MPDVIKVEDKYYILATAARALGTSAVLKDGDTFAIFDAVGDIISAGLGEQGLYHDGTRFLSTLELRLNADRPLLLSSRASPDNLQFGADLTNRDFFLDGRVALAKDLIHVFRSRFLWRGTLYERVRFTNYSLALVRFAVDYEFDADFSDIFEVRGTPRARRGTHLPPRTHEKGHRPRVSRPGRRDAPNAPELEHGAGPHHGVGFAVSTSRSTATRPRLSN